MNKHASDTTAIPTGQTAARSPESPGTPWKPGTHPAAPKDFVDDCQRRRVVPHGRLPEHEVQTGTGLIPVAAPRARDRPSDAPVKPIQFRSSPLPTCRRRTLSPEHLLLRLDRRGVAGSALEEASWAWACSEAPGLFGSTTQYGTAGWERGCEYWIRRDHARPQ